MITCTSMRYASKAVNECKEYYHIWDSWFACEKWRL